MKNFLKEKLASFSLDKTLRLLYLALFIVVVCIGYNKFTGGNNGTKFEQVDILKINNDYSAKAISLIMQLNPNVTPEQKMMKAQKIMQIVAKSLDGLLTEYSVKHQVILLQKQAIASDAGNPLPDVTTKVEDEIDSRISKEQLLNAAQ